LLKNLDYQDVTNKFDPKEFFSFNVIQWQPKFNPKEKKTLTIKMVTKILSSNLPNQVF
jgi:hypothetical protein